MRNKFLSALALLSFLNTQAKNDSCKIKVSEVFINNGTFINQALRGSLDEFKALSNNSSIINQNFDNYYSYSGSRYSGSYNMAQMGIGLQRKNNGPVFRISVAYGMGLQMDLGYYKTSTYRIDTFTSNQTGKQIFVDSSVSDNYTMRHQTKMLQLDASVIWRTTNTNKLKLMGGIGIAVGTTMDASTEVLYSKSAYINNPSTMQYYRPIRTVAIESKAERYMNQNQATYAVYLPMGIDYQLSKKHPIFKQFHLFQETKFRLQYVKVSSYSSALNANLYFGFGLRLNLVKVI
jgi:hypothetical protein